MIGSAGRHRRRVDMGRIGMGRTLLWAAVAVATVAGSSIATEDAGGLLGEFRRIDWDSREVGQDKDLSDIAWQTRIRVERGLVSLGAHALPARVDACSDDNRHVRLLAAHVLGYLNDGAAVAPLIRIAGEDDYAAARLMAVEALGRLGAREGEAVVRAAAEDTNRYIREAAAWALPRTVSGEGVGDSLRELALDTWDDMPIASAVVGEPAPDFALRDADGGAVRLSDYRGRKNVVIISLLADW